MMKLLDILKEAEGFNSFMKKKDGEPDLDFLKHVKKGLSTTMPSDTQPSKEDPEFLSQVQKGLATVDNPAGQAADRITNNMYDKNRPEQPKPPQGADTPPPSLASLAKDAGANDEKDKEDDTFKDFPKFNDADSEDWNQNPFGDPLAGQNTDTRTGLQKGVDAVGKGIKKGATAAAQGIKKGASTLAQKAKQGIANMKGDDDVPANWQPGQSSEPEQDKTDNSPMPSMSNVAKQGLTGKHWQWKPGQKVDIGFVKDLEVVKTDQYGAQLKAKNGSMYRFIPHRGLRKIG